MNRIASSFFLQWFFWAAAASAIEHTNYEALVTSANFALKSQDPGKALALADSAIALNASRYEAYAVRAFILEEKGDTNAALSSIERSIQLAPESKRLQLQAIHGSFTGASATSQEMAAPSAPRSNAAFRRKLEVLRLILSDADAAKNADDRRKFLLEYIQKSDEFVKSNSTVMAVWSLRGAIALELNIPSVGWEAGQSLIGLGADTNASASKLLTQLDRKGWLNATPPSGPTQSPEFPRFLASDIIRVPSAEALKNGAKIEVVTAANSEHDLRQDLDLDEKQLKLCDGLWRARLESLGLAYSAMTVAKVKQTNFLKGPSKLAIHNILTASQWRRLISIDGILEY